MEHNLLKLLLFSLAHPVPHQKGGIRHVSPAFRSLTEFAMTKNDSDPKKGRMYTEMKPFLVDLNICWYIKCNSTFDFISSKYDPYNLVFRITWMI